MEALLNGPTGKMMLSSTRVGIGRLPTNQIVLSNDDQVSGRHAEIMPGGQGYLLIDLGSKNGTYVNQHRLVPDMPYTLHSGDTIRIGQASFTFELRLPSQPLAQRPSQSLPLPQSHWPSQPLPPQYVPQWQPPSQPLLQYPYPQSAPAGNSINYQSMQVVVQQKRSWAPCLILLVLALILFGCAGTLLLVVVR